MKRAETGSKTVGETLDDVSKSLPSLKYAIKLYKKLAQIPALRRNPEDIAAEIREVSGSLLKNGKLSEKAMSQLLLKCTELCYREDCDAEILLHRGADSLKNRFQEAEKKLEQKKCPSEGLTNHQQSVYLHLVKGEIE